MYPSMSSTAICLSWPYRLTMPVRTTSCWKEDTQTTTVDQSLAGELHAVPQGTPVVEGIGFAAKASSARLDQLTVGPYTVINQTVLVYKLPAGGVLPVRGILGEDFLEHFDMLIDNGHSFLCLDDSGAMRADMKGPRTPLVSAGRAYEGGTSCGFLLIEAHLPDRTEPVRLWLDTGANVSFLFKLSDYLFRRLERESASPRIWLLGCLYLVLALPAQDMEIGSLRLHDVPFYTPAIKQKNLQVSEFDGLLSTWLFRRVFIDHADHFAVLETW